LSIFIYLEYFHINSRFLNSFFAVLGFYLLLKAQKYELFWSGFFIGIFWFYWIGLSFRYYDLVYLAPVIIALIALVYALIFRVIGIFSNIFARAVLFFSLSYLSPFGFNWLKLELPLINSYFSTNVYYYAIFLLGIISFIYLSSWRKLFSVLFFAVSLYQPTLKTQKIPLHVKIVKSNINQANKWDKKYEYQIVRDNFILINEAIKNKFDLIILPESAFPQYLNLHTDEIRELQKLSYKIDIVTGGLTYQNKKIYNSSYFFEKGKIQIAHKVILVPFGEEIPLPSFLGKFINKIFFNSASDYARAKNPQNFDIKGIKFRSAICFEATTDKLFKDAPQLMIAISNNAWFKPSIEPTLQHLLLKFYAKKYNTTIYHSANGGIGGIIRP